MSDADLDLVVRARQAVLPGGVDGCEIAVRDGRIVAVEPYGAELTAAEVAEAAADEVVLPGLVDTHVHVNEPGRTDWEGFASATRAAANGGVTTILDMPLNCLPPTLTVDALQTKQAAAAHQCHVDVGFWGGVVPTNLAELRPLHQAGVFGFKCFLLDSGVTEFPPVGPEVLTAAMERIAAVDGLLVVHAEDAAVITEPPSGRSYSAFLRSRPAAAEVAAVTQVVEAARRTGARAHIVHVSAAEVLPVLAAARADGVHLTAETCPHYLTLSAEEVPDGATAYKCCPPIRDRANQEHLWNALQHGTLDCVVSDHSPCTVDLKRLDTGDFATAWGGVSSLQVTLPVVWTQARARGIPLQRVVGWMAHGPADVVGLTRKGRIAPGCDADLVCFAPDSTFVVDPHRLHHKNPITPYAGQTLHGAVRRTWLRGAPAGTGPPHGRFLNRGA